MMHSKIKLMNRDTLLEFLEDILQCSQEAKRPMSKEGLQIVHSLMQIVQLFFEEEECEKKEHCQIKMTYFGENIFYIQRSSVPDPRFKALVEAFIKENASELMEAMGEVVDGRIDSFLKGIAHNIKDTPKNKTSRFNVVH